jgi:hypothetical protein
MQGIFYTLKGSARRWLGSLQPGSVGCFNDLCKQFHTKFIVGRRRRRPVAYLLTLKQRKNESIKDYIARVNKEKLTVDVIEE